MDISFTSLAFTLKYSSVNIDTVYVALDILGRGDHKIPVHILLNHRQWLPKDFIEWLDSNADIDNICFEERSYPQNDPHGDWELIVL